MVCLLVGNPPMNACNHNHQISVNFPENSPPTLTPRRRSCGCTLTILGVSLSLLFLTLIALESPFIAFENSRIQSRMRSAPYRKDHPPVRIPDPIIIGLWDENKMVTALQLIVCISLALGINEEHVSIVNEGSHFFLVTVVHEGSWVLEAVNSEESVAFLDALNVQSRRFGARMVVSHNAHRKEATPPPPSPPP